MPADRPGSGLREHLLLLSKYLRSPRRVGAVAPSSRRLARAMVRDLDPAAAGRVVELGPGTGAFTGAIRERLGPRGRLLAVEVDPAFAELVRGRWPDVTCVCGSAEHLSRLVRAHDFGPVDHIVSGLPFASLPAAVTEAIVDEIARVLRPGGTFATFQYVHAWRLARAVAFRDLAGRRFGAAPERRVVLWNVPPAYALVWRAAGRP